MSPEDVRLAVVVEISNPFDLPGRRDGGEGRTGSDIHPVHVPDHIFSRRGLSPEDVRLAVVVEISNPFDLPGRRDGGEGRTGSDIHPVHVPDHIFSRRGLSPEDIRVPIPTKTHIGDCPIPKADRTRQLRIGNLEKAGLPPPGSPTVLDDKALVNIIIANDQNRMRARQASSHIMINPALVREEVLIDRHCRDQGAVSRKSIFDAVHRRLGCGHILPAGNSIRRRLGSGVIVC